MQTRSGFPTGTFCGIYLKGADGFFNPQVHQVAQLSQKNEQSVEMVVPFSTPLSHPVQSHTPNLFVITCTTLLRGKNKLCCSVWHPLNFPPSCSAWCQIEFNSQGYEHLSLKKNCLSHWRFKAHYFFVPCNLSALQRANHFLTCLTRVISSSMMLTNGIENLIHYFHGL